MARKVHLMRKVYPFLLFLLILVLARQTCRAQVVNGYQFQAQNPGYVALGASAVRVPVLETDESMASALPLGFTFAANGRYYTEASVSSNGWLALGFYGSFGPSPVGFPYLYTTARWMAAPLWANLSGQGGAASYQTTGTAPNRVFAFEWRDWRWDHLAPQAVVSFQVRLYEGSNRVEFSYQSGAGSVSAAASDARAIIGLLSETSAAPRVVLLSDVGAAPSLNPSPQTAVLTRPATGQQYSFTPSPNTLPACPVPDAPSVAVLRRDNARVSIINSSLGGTYRVHYGVRGFVLGSPDDQLAAVAADTAHLAGLLLNQDYEMLLELECAPGAGPARSLRELFRTNEIPSNDAPDRARWLPVLNNLNRLNLASGFAKYASPTPAAALSACGSTPLVPGGARDLWYVFRATGATHAIALAEASTPFVLEVRNGTGPTAQVLNCRRTQATGATQLDTLRLTSLVAGQAYFIRVYPTTAYTNSNYSNAFDSFRVGVTGVLPTVPPNDDCAQSPILPVGGAGGITTPGTLAAATASLPNAVNAAGHCAGSSVASRDVWYRFISPGPSVIVRFEPDFFGVVEEQSTCGSLGVYPIACVSVIPGGSGSMAITGLSAGASYVLRVYRYSEYEASDNLGFRLTLSTPVPPPVNDDCAHALVLPLTPRGQVGLHSTLAGATSSGIAGSATCTWLNVGAPGGQPVAPANPEDVWYRFTASAVQQVLTLDAATDAVLEVFDSGASGLPPCVAGAGAPVRLGCTFANLADIVNPGQHLPGRVLLNGLVTGRQYWARVYAAVGSTLAIAVGQPEFDLSVHEWAAPANDEPAQAQPLLVSVTAEPCTTGVDFTLDGATPTLPPTGTASAERDVWFTFVAPAAIAPYTLATAVVRFNFSEPLLIGRLEIRDGPGATARVLTAVYNTSLGIRPMGYAGISSSTLVPGQTYYLRCATSLPTPEPSSHFRVCLAPRISNDEPCGALPLPLEPSGTQCQGTVRGTVYYATTSRINAGVQPAVSNCGGDAYQRDVWYRVVPISTAFTLRCDDIAIDQARLYRPVSAAGCAGELQLVNCQASQLHVNERNPLTLGTVVFDNVVIGQPYYLAVSRAFTRTSYSAFTDEFTLCAQQALALPTTPAVGIANGLGKPWPNPVPAGQELQLQLPAQPGTAGLPVQVQWLTVLGQPAGDTTPLVMTPSAGGRLRVATSGRTPGLYLLRMWGADGRPLGTSRVVVE